MDHSDLVPDPVWTERYEREAERIRNATDPLDVFHVGSTAIPGVPGKPALDVLAVYPDGDAMQSARDVLAAGDYEVQSEDESCVVLTREIDAGVAIVKLHTPGDNRVTNQLLFRDYLRENGDARRKYGRVKREAAAEHPDDLAAYTQHKEHVVGELLARAREEGYDERLPAFV